ncbi:MAG: hypothetical protein AB7I04_17785 [Pseudomonadales bacterium]
MPVDPRRANAIAGLKIVCLLLAGCDDRPVRQFVIAGHTYDTAHVRHMALPKTLREISGLAPAGPGQVWAHNDERGEVFLIDHLTPTVIGSFELSQGDQAQGVKDDFEGVATLGERLFLVTSRGIVYESRIGGPGETVAVVRHDGGLDCEVEGLAAAPDGRALLAACKNLPPEESGIVVHAWNLETRAYDTASPALSVSEEVLTEFMKARFPDQTPPERIQPTGIAVTGAGNLLLVAARQHLLLEFTAEGSPVAVAVLDPAVHRQAEGIDLDADGRLLVASEGDGKGDRKTPGVLSVYEPTH